MSPRREDMRDSGRRRNRIVNLSSKGDWLRPHVHVRSFARSFWQYRPLRSHVTVALHYLWVTAYYSLTLRDEMMAVPGT